MADVAHHLWWCERRTVEYFEAVFGLAGLPRQEMGATAAWSGPCIGDPYILYLHEMMRLGTPSTD